MSSTTTPPAAVSREGSLSRNAAMNLASYVTTIVLALIVSPIVIRHLGDARYGAWTLVAELVGYSGLLDMGVRWAVSYYVVQHLGRNEWEQINKLLSTAVILLSCVGAIVALAGVIFGWLFPLLFKVQPQYVPDVRWALGLLSLVIGISFPLEVYSAVLYAYRRLDVQSGIEIASSLISSAGFLVVVYSGGGLIALAIVQTVSRVIAWTIRVFYTRRLADDVHLHVSLFRWELVRQLLGFGSKNFAINLARTVLSRTQSMIVGAAIGVEMITRYRIGSSLVDYMFSAVGAVAMAFTPHFTYLLARGEQASARKLYLTATRLSATCAFMLPAYVFVFGAAFVGLWIHPRYVTGPAEGRSDVVLYILLCGFIPRFIQSISWQFLAGAGKLDAMLWITVGEAVTSIVLCAIFVNWWGIIGVALGTALPIFLSNVFLVPGHVMKIIGLDRGEYWKRGVVRPLACGIAAFLSGMAMKHLVAPSSWGTLILDVAVSGSVGLAVVYAAGLETEDRELIKVKAQSFFSSQKTA